MTEQDIERVAQALFPDWFGEDADEYCGNPELTALAQDQARERAKTAIVAMNQWQPIETAPTEGTRYLAFMNDGQDTQMEVASTSPNNQGQLITVVGGRFSFDMPTITHWMPLPDPPSN